MSRVTPILSGTLTALNQTSLTVRVYRHFNVSLWGTFSATVQVQRSFNAVDGGSTWIPVSLDSTGTAADYTAAVSVTGYEPEDEVYYRFQCTAYASGTVNYRLSQ